MTRFLPLPARRTIIHGEAIAWLNANRSSEGHSVITSLPDVSEMPQRGFEGWRSWFIEAAQCVMRWIPDEGAAIFFQSDIRYEGLWIDKSYLLMQAAALEGLPLVWRKVVCRKPPGAISLGRPTYSHMLCFVRSQRLSVRRPGPDVLVDAGFMSWSRAMGETACRVACRFLRDETKTSTIVDPFCGEGAVLAIANEMGFEATGVDLSVKRCRVAATQGAMRRVSLGK